MNKISDYGLIGDCHSAALVGQDGSIDWACFPRFDSPSVFARNLDESRGGHFRIAPEFVEDARRAYLQDTNILTTTFECSGGVLELTDCMPVETPEEPGGTRVRVHHSILRRARCTIGTVNVRVSVAPRFEYGSLLPRFTPLSARSAYVEGGANAIVLNSTRPVEVLDTEVVAEWTLHAGEEVWMEATWSRSYARHPRAPSLAKFEQECRRRLEATTAYWRLWIEQCSYEGVYAPFVRRSALALKALTYAPSGAMVAAPTTSLPELIGGGRNWDYRYTWIRDATMALSSLVALGFRHEAEAFRSWLERATAGRAQNLQIMYGVEGERHLPEMELPHLTGHRNSAPVRIGNAAAVQTQLDVYGQILDAAYLYGKAGGDFSTKNWTFLTRLVESAAARWHWADHGIWELRDEPRHFTHSKLHCWVALDRGIRIAQARGLPAPIERWERARDEIRDFLLEQAAPDGWFQQAAGYPVADAATLLAPALGLVPTDHPLALRTIQEVRAQLEHNGLVYRYKGNDGLEGQEGAFLVCSFWLVDCLVHTGEIGEAQALLERLLTFGGDLGLFPEQVDPATGEGLGNFPQAFSHMALVLSCGHLEAAKHGGVHNGGSYAELAVERLMARRGSKSATVPAQSAP
ncbi:MAG: glycoside hydrolase family 15 protein [Actinomycetota bacterium]